MRSLIVAAVLVGLVIGFVLIGGAPLWPKMVPRPMSIGGLTG